VKHASVFRVSALGWVLACLVLAACERAEVAVSEAAYRAPLRPDGPGAAYFTIVSPVADQIVGVSSERASEIEIHTIVTDEAGATMKRVETVDLPAGRSVRFEPGGLHLMVFGAEPVAPGEAFPITFSLRSGQTRTIDFPPAEAP